MEWRMVVPIASGVVVGGVVVAVASRRAASERRNNMIANRTCKVKYASLSSRDRADDVANIAKSNRRAMVVCVGSETDLVKNAAFQDMSKILTHKTRLLSSQILALKHSIQYLEGLMFQDGRFRDTLDCGRVGSGIQIEQTSKHGAFHSALFFTTGTMQRLIQPIMHVIDTSATQFPVQDRCPRSANRGTT
jgi:hypothetical protein